MRRFSAKVGPGTVTNGPGLNNASYIGQKYPGRPIIRPFRDDFLVDPQKLKSKIPPQVLPNQCSITNGVVHCCDGHKPPAAHKRVDVVAFDGAVNCTTPLMELMRVGYDGHNGTGRVLSAQAQPQTHRL